VPVFCCQLGGIVAIIYAAGANSAREAGDYATGVAKAGTAKTWLWISLATPFVIIGLWLLLVLVGAVGLAVFEPGR
jgi:hypothetical protein